MSNDPLGNHPDLRDAEWLRKANHEAMKDIRRMRRKARRGKRIRRLVSAGLLVAIIAVGFVMYRQGLFDGSRPEAATGTSSGAPSTTATTMIPDVVVDLNQPFVGTPAAGWADGEAGIVAPAAAPVGRYSAKQVAEGYAKVRQVLITARLDRKVIEGHDVQPYLALFAPAMQEKMRPEFAGQPDQSYAYATRIADGFRLLPVQPKVNGRMWAEPGPNGELVIRTDYVFAYAFHTDNPDRLLDVMDIVAVDRFQAGYALLDERWPASDRGLWADTVEWYGYSIACDAYKKGSLAPAYSERRPDGDPEGHDKDRFFDPSRPMPTDQSC